MFQNKIVLITGGSGGIGSAVVKRFATNGATVLFTYKSNEENAVMLEKELTEKNFVVSSIKMDITNSVQVRTIVQELYKKYGKIDVLVNNAGITEDGFLMLMDESSWNNVIDTNLKGSFLCCKEVLSCMISKKQGVIINIASVAGLMGVTAQTNYCASKFGVIGLTRALAKEVASKNIRVNAVAPGYIDTDMLKKVPAHIRDNFVETIPCKHLGNPDDVAKVVLFLASEDSNYIIGQTIVVDGGLLS